MGRLKRAVGVADHYQRHHRIAGAAYGMVKKFSDDNANLLVVSLGWYGFLAIFPLLLLVVTVLGFIGANNLGSGVVDTLHKFPVVGADFNPGGSHFHGSAFGLVIGLLGLLYGAQGVTQTAQQAMATVWDVPRVDRAGYLPRLGRSLLGLVVIGLTFLVNAAVSGYATGGHESYAIRVPVIFGLLILNVGGYYLSFAVLTPSVVRTRSLLPGAVLGAFAFTLLITVGTGLITHQLKNASTTYGTFGSVIGIVAFLLLLAKLSIYAAELNPVLAHELYPRALPMGNPTEADHRALRAMVEEERRRKDETIDVDFDPCEPDPGDVLAVVGGVDPVDAGGDADSSASVSASVSIAPRPVNAPHGG